MPTATKRIEYLQIPTGPGSLIRIYAENIARLAAAELGIATPTVKFFVRAEKPALWSLRAWSDDQQLHGEFRSWRPGEIWVSADLDRAALAETVAHECAHAAWHAAYGTAWPSSRTYTADVAADEAAAVGFASRFARRLKS